MEDNILILDDLGDLISGQKTTNENGEEVLIVGEKETEVIKDTTEKVELKGEGEGEGIVPESEEEFKEKEEEKDKNFEDTISTISGSRGLTKFARSMVENGEWEDLIIETEKGDVKLSEIKSLTEEQINAVYTEQKKIREEKFKEDFISIKDLPEYKKEIMAIIKEGGKELTEAIKNDPSIRTPPFENVDLEDVNSRAKVYINDLIAKGIPQDDALSLAKNAETRGDLISKAEDIVNKAKEDYLGELKRIKEELAEDNKTTLAREKEFKKDLYKTFIDNNYDPKMADKLVKIGTEKSEDGAFKIDDLYYDMMEDPNKAYELISFLTDRENFIKTIRREVKKEEGINTMLNMRRITSSEANRNKKEDRVDNILIID